MPKQSPLSPQDDIKLFNTILDPEIANDPYKFVMFIFPWGVEGTPLAKHNGPRKWQTKILKKIAKHIKKNGIQSVNNLPYEMMQHSTVSGRGIGKSALVAWLVLWMMSCVIGSTTIVTANTETQLVTRTWPEVGKWHTLALNSHWFEKTATKLKPEGWFEALVQTRLKIDTGYYYANAQLWAEDNPDAFAGAHNFNGMLLIYDEASGIPKPIWSVSEGFFTEPVLHRYWHVFSNGRRNTGPFFETHHKDRDFWEREQVDSRTVEGTDKAIYDKIIAQHGEDSDEARVEVKGMFPRSGDKQFISRELVQTAIDRETYTDPGAALLLMVDVARFGDDYSVIGFRQGRDARSRPYHRFKGLNTVQLANRVAELADEYRPDAIIVDGNGLGAGVVDNLTEMQYSVIEPPQAADKERYVDKRAEMWGEMKEWLDTGCIPDDPLLLDDLVTPEYEFNLHSQIKLESKKDMKKRGFASPDIGDMLAMSFVRRFGRRDAPASRRRTRTRRAKDVDYSLFG